ncbi:methyltransferase domain-containing protein [Streptomyces sp. NPDC087850]|uniref:methyltransferase domain-containing protein n=1 Tax=Streptomyces sp. NPDC087850 TaxID=3365809 RepID=UPI0037F4FFC5
MIIDQQDSEQGALSGLLQAVDKDLGHPLAPEWRAAAEVVARHRFLPERVWLGDGHGGYAPCDRSADPRRWLRAAYADAPVVTQVNDGAQPVDSDSDGIWPSSSASAPSIVFRMLEELALVDGISVLEIGTGTGWNAGLLAHRLGVGNVTSVEVDPEVAARARTALKAVGLGPDVVCGDGSLGVPGRAPFDRTVSTCAVRSVPPAWIAQTKPGGVILTPWESPWLGWGLLRLTVRNGAAEGRFQPYSSFMLMRGHRTDLRIFRDVVRDAHQPDESRTVCPAHTIGADAWDLGFAIGLCLPDVWKTWEDDPGVDGVVRRLWIATTDATSWAAVDHAADQAGAPDGPFTVWQYGGRRLWDEVEGVYRWWVEQERPGPERFGLTVTAGTASAWLDGPARLLPRTAAHVHAPVPAHVTRR